MDVPEHLRFNWLRDKDIQERKLWVKEFQNSDNILGQVIAEVFIRRDAHWETSKDSDKQGNTAPRTNAPPAVDKPELKRRKTNTFQQQQQQQQPQAKGDQGGKPGKGQGAGKGGNQPLPFHQKFGKKIATQTKNGTPICPARNL